MNDTLARHGRISEAGVSRATTQAKRTYRHTNWFARREEAARLMSVIASEVEPPPPLSLNALDVFATVLTMRSERRGT